MKVFFFLLLVINLAFFAYHYLYASKPIEPLQVHVAVSEKGDEIRLAGEVDKAPGHPASDINATQNVDEGAGNAQTRQTEEDSPTLAAPPNEAKLVESCFELKGFASQEEAKSALDQLLDKGFTGQVDSFSERVLSGYWVMTKRFTSRNEALKVKRAMQSAAVDSFIIESGEDKSAISVGLFKSRRNASERQEEVAKLGFDVAVKEQYRELESYKLAVAYRGLQTAPAPLNVIAKSEANLSSEEKKCSDPVELQ